jgi:hypothetical protein
VLWWAGAALLVTMLLHVAALLITGGSLTGPVSLRKPATFAETGWLLCWSTALLLPVLGLRGWQQHTIGTAVVLFGVGETSIMAIQAWRGVASHYNFSTPLDIALMRGGAAGTAAIFVIAVLNLLVATLRARIPSDVRLGVVAGVLVLLVGCALGLVMIFNNSGVFQGTVGVGFTERTSGYLGPDPATVGYEYLLIRPATAGGDLVLPHAIGVHGLLLLAVPAVLLARTPTPVRRRLRIMVAAVAAVAVAMAILLVHAWRRLPLHALSLPALAAWGLCALALLGSWVAVGSALGDELSTRPGASRELSGRGSPAA